MMPERERLSNTLFCVAPLRSPEGISAVKDLISLLKNSCRVAYQPLLRPLRSKCSVPHRGVERCSVPHCGAERCPVPHCGVELERMHIDRRWRHVFECSLAYHKGEHKLVDFCFICNNPVAGQKAWEIHCQGHVARHELPLRCDFVKFRRAIACAGRCMTCMHDTRLPATRRLYGFKKQASWEKHVNECFLFHVNNLGKTDMIPCLDPECFIAYESD
ncbi:hypothetical protein B0T17DRAFT_149461 [Bombardia bombarda]|uniref:Uncharacterized protein n=1 Tax=Bombardia bombarda TaxID=252184 RepID=A0AA39X6N7_9PEZI|nr:hypothetical protein B0T17DRAFT_149461 [Bombardia bombarda]